MTDGLTLRTLSAGEGAKLVDCVRRCYGATHVTPSLYDANAIDAELESGGRHSAVAVTDDGEIVGHLGLVFRERGDNTADAGLTMVDPRHRGRGLAHELAIELGRIAMRLDLVGLHDYPVTVHGGTQRLATEHAVAVGLLLDNMPGDVEFTDMDAAKPTDRATPSLVRYIALKPAPVREVHVPGQYVELVRCFYDQSLLSRTVRTGEVQTGANASLGDADIEVATEARRAVVRVVVRSLGARPGDLERRISSHIPAGGALQVDLPLFDPGTPAAASALRGSGFFFGALLPEFHEGDVLRMQRLGREPQGAEVPKLESATLQAVADFVARDWAVVAGTEHRPTPP